MLPVCTRPERIAAPPPEPEPELMPGPVPHVPPLPDPEPTTCPSAEECKRCMALYETLEADIKQAAARLKVLRSLRESTAAVISRFLEGHRKDEISTRDNRLHLKLESKERKIPFSKKQLEVRMVDAFDGDAARYDDFRDRVYRDQRTVSKTVLKRIKGRALKPV